VVIENLELADFRNFPLRKLAFSSENIFFTGPNGSGKSNLLESIAFLSLLRSFRTSSPKELIRIGARSFRLSADVRTAHGRERLTVSEQLSGRRELWIGAAPVRRSSEFIREFHAVVFSPEDRAIANGSSGHRRKFFDILISTVEPEYMMRLGCYTRALMQRNRAFKTAPAMAGAFDGELAAHAPYLTAKRREYAAIVERDLNKLLSGRGEFNIIYRADTPETAEEFAGLLVSRRESELRRMCTLAGPQLDEFEFIFNGKLLRSFGSTGQIRLITLLLKLVQFDLVRNNSPAPVVTLADDVTGELDKNNLDLFLQTISRADQSFFTFAEIPGFSLPDCTIHRANEGGVFCK